MKRVFFTYPRDGHGHFQTGLSAGHNSQYMRPLDVRLQKFLFDNGLTMPEFQLMFFAELGGYTPSQIINVTLRCTKNGEFPPMQTTSDKFSRSDYENALSSLINKGLVCLCDEAALREMQFVMQLDPGPQPHFELPSLGYITLTLLGTKVWQAIETHVYDDSPTGFGAYDEESEGVKQVCYYTDREWLEQSLKSQNAKNITITEIRPWRELWWRIHEVAYKVEYIYKDSPEERQRHQAKRKRRDNDKN